MSGLAQLNYAKERKRESSLAIAPPNRVIAGVKADRVGGLLVDDPAAGFATALAENRRRLEQDAKGPACAAGRYLTRVASP